MTLKHATICVQSLLIILITDTCHGLTYYYGNGSHYVGNVDELGRPSGDGLYYTKRGGLMYNGTFNDGLFEGQGTWFGNNGHHYEGDFSWGLGNGAGTWTTPKGDAITGNFRNHTLHGEAVWLFSPESPRLQRMVGHFRRGLAHGDGIVYFRDGSRLEVKFKKGYPHGAGVLYSQNGERMWEGLVWNGTPLGVVPDDILDLFTDFHLNPLRLRNV
jgi:hypothetical protein